MATLGKSTITELSLLNALSVKDGGTGATTFTSGSVLIGNGAEAIGTRAITNNTTATAVAASTNLITANTLYYHKGNSNIVTVGTITSGTWQGTAIANAYLANSKVTVAGKDISLGGSLSAADLKTALGLNNVSNTAASGYLTALSSNTTNAVSITVGGTTKNITVATMKSSLGLGALAYKASLGKADVGLGNVDNTADANKSVNYATTAGSVSSISSSGITSGYLNIHPENSPTIIPFVNNDLAFLNKKGGSYSLYSTTSTDYTASTLSQGTLSLSSGDNMFDGSPAYATISTLGAYVTVIDLSLHQHFKYSNVFYIDFGSSSWRARNISLYVMNTDTDTKYTLKNSITDNAKGNWFSSVSHTDSAKGFNRIRVVLSRFLIEDKIATNQDSSSGRRIAQIGLYNYGSKGVTETFISRGGCDGIYGSLVPQTTNNINLGSSAKVWAKVYATSFEGNATSATKATKDASGNVITSTYLPFTGGTLAGSSTNTPLNIKGTSSGNDAWIGFYNSTGTNSSTFLASIGVDSSKNFKLYKDSKSYTVWHEGNDGTGSGLDADKLDGYEATAFAQASSLASYLPLTGGTVSGVLCVDGNIGIGTTSPSYKLHVNGSFYATSGSISGKRILTEDDLSNVGGGGGGTTITDYVSTTKETTQSILSGLIIGASSISSPSMSAGRLMLTGSSNPLIGVQATGGTLFYFQSKGDTMLLGPTEVRALAFTGSTGAISMPNTLTVTGNVTAPTFVGALSGNATSAEAVNSYTSASSDGTARPVWFAWNDGSKKPAYHTNFTYTVNTGTLAAANFSGHLIGNGNYYGVCGTAQATKAKTVTIDGFPSTLTAGLRVTIKFTNAAAASTMTLKINDLEAKNICQYGTTAASSGTTTTGWRAGSVQTFTYDGTSWVREYWANTTYSNVSLGHGYATSNSSDGATTITATLSSYALSTGGTVAVKFTYAVPANAYLSINSKTATAIYYKGVSITAGIIYAGDTATFIYDGTAYHLISIDRGMEGGAVVASSSAAIELVPNNLYVASSASSLTVTFKTPTNANAINNYMLQVTAGSSGCSITFPTGVKWANGIAPTLDANATYQFSILNGCGVWTKFA